VQEAAEAPPRRRPVLVGYGVAEDEPEAAAQQPAEGAAREGPAPATPPVRRLAKELGVDLSSITGSGPRGRVTREDVERAASAPAARPGPAGPVERIPVRGTRRLIAQKMARSAREIPHVTTFLSIDAYWLEAFRQELAVERGDRVSALPIIVRARAEITLRHPKLNASFDEEAAEIVLYRDCHVGIAVDTDRGLLVPVIHDAGDLNIAGLARRIADLAARTRTNKITPDEMSGGTFTLSNTGSRGALFDTPIILQPQVGILGTGSVVKRPVVLSGDDGDTIAIRSMVYLALSYDHRLVDGADAARFLNTIKQRLTDGAFEVGLGM
jgi:pyruvate dehydrogenase E2 component (dihydrolipoamide acetyltransferase)